MGELMNSTGMTDVTLQFAPGAGIVHETVDVGGGIPGGADWVGGKGWFGNLPALGDETMWVFIGLALVALVLIAIGLSLMWMQDTEERRARAVREGDFDGVE